MLSSQKTSEMGIVSNFLVLQISVLLFNCTNILQNKKSAPCFQSAEPQNIHQNNLLFRFGLPAAVVARVGQTRFIHVRKKCRRVIARRIYDHLNNPLD